MSILPNVSANRNIYLAVFNQKRLGSYTKRSEYDTQFYIEMVSQLQWILWDLRNSFRRSRFCKLKKKLLLFDSHRKRVGSRWLDAHICSVDELLDVVTSNIFCHNDGTVNDSGFRDVSIRSKPGKRGYSSVIHFTRRFGNKSFHRSPHMRQLTISFSSSLWCALSDIV